MNKELWSDDYTYDEIEKIHEYGTAVVVFNLYEDICVLKEQLAESKPLDTQLKDYVLVPINKIHSIHSRNLEDTITRLELKNELEEMMGFES